MSYTLSHSCGWYVGFDAVHRAFAVDKFVFNVWASGSYSIIRGTGRHGWTDPAFRYFPDAATSTFVTSSVAIGISASADF
jgi:hypothetical protein